MGAAVVVLPEAFSGDPEEVVTPRENLFVAERRSPSSTAKAAVRSAVDGGETFVWKIWLF